MRVMEQTYQLASKFEKAFFRFILLSFKKLVEADEPPRYTPEEKRKQKIEEEDKKKKKKKDAKKNPKQT